jgi:hypothetical protein
MSAGWFFRVDPTESYSILLLFQMIWAEDEIAGWLDDIFHEAAN